MALIDDPERMRNRAAEMRARAEKAVLPETRRGLLRIAEDFDVLAARAEQRLAVLRKRAEQPEGRTIDDPSLDRQPGKDPTAPSDRE